MLSFLAMIWPPDDPGATDAGRAFQAIPALRAKATYHSPESGLYLADLSEDDRKPAIIPCGPSGAVYGTVFRRSSSLSPSSGLDQFSGSEAAAVLNSCGDRLLDGFWGSYIGFLRTQRGVRVLADPASSIPCFYTVTHRVTFVFSHLERCPAALRKDLEPNRRFVSQVIAYDKIQNGETALSDVRELVSGYCLQVDDASPREILAWDPKVIARRPDNTPVPEAAAELRQVIRYVVTSRAMAEPKIALRLSGGLDSAIVAASLRDDNHGFDIQAVHYVLEGGDPSEAFFARSIAKPQGLMLVEHGVDPATPLPGADQCPATVRPYREFLGLNQISGDKELPALSGRTVFTGQGGDHLFQEIRTSLGFADFLLLNGLHHKTLSELVSAARLSKQSVWRVLQEALPVVMDGRTRNSPLEAGLFSRRTRANRFAFAGLKPEDLVPAWARDPGGLPPAKFAQVTSLVHMFQNRTAIYVPDAPSVVHPLISQPLIEFCLRTPVHTLCAGGISRGLARLAMKGRVPDIVRLRRTKGDASRFYIEQLASNLPLLSETLLNGELVAGGYIDREDIRRLLQPDSFRLQTFSQTGLVYYAIECWLRRWKSERNAV